MKIANPSKAFILLATLVCITLLIALGRIGAEQGLPILTMCAGYGIGNGVGALREQKSPHIFEPSQDK